MLTVMDTPTTVADWLSEWLSLQPTRLQPATLKEYQGVADRYLRPHLGEIFLSELSHRDITRFYQSLLTHGGLRGKPLSLVTVRRIAAITHKLFADAARQELLDTNPCTAAVLPRVDPTGEPQELRVWTAEQLKAFLERERHRPLWALWVVAAGTGMRRGELLGLRWKDVDLGAQRLHVRRALSVVRNQARLKVPKTNQARSLAIGPAVIDALHHRRAEQAHFAGAPLPHEAPESARWDLVFTAPDGGHLQPQRVTDTWREAVRDAPQPVIRFHDIRHTHATLLLQAGVSPKVVSARLGHASVKTTLDIYAEVLPAMDEDAAADFEAHVWGTP